MARSHGQRSLQSFGRSNGRHCSPSCTNILQGHCAVHHDLQRCCSLVGIVVLAATSFHLHAILRHLSSKPHVQSASSRDLQLQILKQQIQPPLTQPPLPFRTYIFSRVSNTLCYVTTPLIFKSAVISQGPIRASCIQNIPQPQTVCLFRDLERLACVHAGHE